MAQAMLDNGMHRVGFDHLNLDDCWAATTRTATGEIRPDPARFPSGMKAVAERLHHMGLKFGLYSSMGSHTCNRGGRDVDIPGSFDHYVQDAATFASWDMDYVKMDWCGGALTNPQAQHTAFSAAMNKTGRPMWLELCRGYSYDPIPEYVAQVANSWRTTGDHQDEWSNTIKVIKSFWAPSNPGVPHAWNYGDFLMTGGPGCNVNETLHCPRSSDDEYRTAFATWVIAASPLIVATDIRNMTAVMKQCLLNEEAIFINQDASMPAGKLVGNWKCNTSVPGQCPVMVRPLSDGTYAVLLTNLHDTTSHSLTVPYDWLNRNGASHPAMSNTTRASVRDVLNQTSLGAHFGFYESAVLSPHQSVLLRVTPDFA